MKAILADRFGRGSGSEFPRCHRTARRRCSGVMLGASYETRSVEVFGDDGNFPSTSAAFLDLFFRHLWAQRSWTLALASLAPL